MEKAKRQAFATLDSNLIEHREKWNKKSKTILSNSSVDTESTSTIPTVDDAEFAFLELEYQGKEGNAIKPQHTRVHGSKRKTPKISNCSNASVGQEKFNEGHGLKDTRNRRSHAASLSEVDHQRNRRVKEDEKDRRRKKLWLKHLKIREGNLNDHAPDLAANYEKAYSNGCNLLPEGEVKSDQEQINFQSSSKSIATENSEMLNKAMTHDHLCERNSVSKNRICSNPNIELSFSQKNVSNVHEKPSTSGQHEILSLDGTDCMDSSTMTSGRVTHKFLKKNRNQDSEILLNNQVIHYRPNRLKHQQSPSERVQDRVKDKVVRDEEYCMTPKGGFCSIESPHPRICKTDVVRANHLPLVQSSTSFRNPSFSDPLRKKQQEYRPDDKVTWQAMMAKPDVDSCVSQGEFRVGMLIETWNKGARNNCGTSASSVDYSVLTDDSGLATISDLSIHQYMLQNRKSTQVLVENEVAKIQDPITDGVVEIGKGNLHETVKSVDRCKHSPYTNQESYCSKIGSEKNANSQGTSAHHGGKRLPKKYDTNKDGQFDVPGCTLFTPASKSSNSTEKDLCDRISDKELQGGITKQSVEEGCVQGASTEAQRRDVITTKVVENSLESVQESSEARRRDGTTKNPVEKASKSIQEGSIRVVCTDARKRDHAKITDLGYAYPTTISATIEITNLNHSVQDNGETCENACGSWESKNLYSEAIITPKGPAHSVSHALDQRSSSKANSSPESSLAPRSCRDDDKGSVEDGKAYHRVKLLDSRLDDSDSGLGFCTSASPEIWTADLAAGTGDINFGINIAPIFKLNEKVYRHPPLPPGWRLGVSKSKSRPYYCHPNFGISWYAPLPLPSFDGTIKGTHLRVPVYSAIDDNSHHESNAQRESSHDKKELSQGWGERSSDGGSGPHQEIIAQETPFGDTFVSNNPLFSNSSFSVQLTPLCERRSMGDSLSSTKGPSDFFLSPISSPTTSRSFFDIANVSSVASRSSLEHHNQTTNPTQQEWDIDRRLQHKMSSKTKSPDQVIGSYYEFESLLSSPSLETITASRVVAPGNVSGGQHLDSTVHETPSKIFQLDIVRQDSLRDLPVDLTIENIADLRQYHGVKSCSHPSSQSKLANNFSTPIPYMNPKDRDSRPQGDNLEFSGKATSCATKLNYLYVPNSPNIEKDFELSNREEEAQIEGAPGADECMSERQKESLHLKNSIEPMIYDVMASNLRASIGGNAPSDGLSPSATDSIDELAATSILYENVTQRLKIKSGVTSVPLNTPKTSIELQFVPENDTKSLGAASDESHNTWTGSSLSRRIRDGFETLRALEPSMPLCSLQFTVRANMAPKERKRLKNLQLQALRKGSRKAFAVPLRHRSCLK